MPQNSSAFNCCRRCSSQGPLQKPRRQACTKGALNVVLRWISNSRMAFLPESRANCRASSLLAARGRPKTCISLMETRPCPGVSKYLKSNEDAFSFLKPSIWQALWNSPASHFPEPSKSKAEYQAVSKSTKKILRICVNSSNNWTASGSSSLSSTKPVSSSSKEIHKAFMLPWKPMARQAAQNSVNCSRPSPSGSSSKRQARTRLPWRSLRNSRNLVSIASASRLSLAKRSAMSCLAVFV
mmetsp:Transcript_73318/g.238626  ORF Transcript_73318/g.238626 Transcript_73318/m.238626 type:complete len:240 (+) Transcript_73318:654-1373(+)